MSQKLNIEKRYLILLQSNDEYPMEYPSKPHLDKRIV